uniref:Uncharacterized protein n=1 Tax=Anguilla anguilla TaxID=7936 RepID=A0A0E9RD48_ANGAN
MLHANHDPLHWSAHCQALQTQLRLSHFQERCFAIEK